MPGCSGLRWLPKPTLAELILRSYLVQVSQAPEAPRQETNATSRIYLPYTMRPGVAVLSLFLYILAALGAPLRRPTPVHGESRQHQLALPLLDNLSWLLPEVTPADLLPPVYATGSTKPIIAQ